MADLFEEARRRGAEEGRGEDLHDADGARFRAFSGGARTLAGAQCVCVWSDEEGWAGLAVAGRPRQGPVQSPGALCCAAELLCPNAKSCPAALPPFYTAGGVVGGEPAQQAQRAQPSERRVTVTFYRNGVFTVDDGGSPSLLHSEQ